MLSDGVRRIGDGYGWAVEETAGGGDGQVIANANGNLVVICVCAGLGVRRRAIASARSSFSGLLVQCHELQCHKKHATSTCFLNSAAIPAGSFACGVPPAGSSVPIPNTEHTTPAFFFFFLPLSFLTSFHFPYLRL